jgi:DNA-binding NtrC family response regulator
LAGSGQALAPFIFITGYGAVDQAVRLLKLGAQDYVTKPFDVGELIAKIRALCERLQPMTDVASTLGISAGMRQIEGLLPRLAASRSAVLISGESGAGKEEVARALHRIGDPTGKTPFVAVNCGAIPENLIESELFGHDKGAFTGAERERKGVFEQADGGTLFLDEIGEMPPTMQVKLLRAIQDRAIVHVGGATRRQVDIRLVCATHHDLKAMVEQGRFREDLYYRIHVVHLHVPPLRERQEDILWLAARLLDARAARGEARRTLSPEAEHALARYPWPGNVRELAHCLERACVLSLAPQLRAEACSAPAQIPAPRPRCRGRTSASTCRTASGPTSGAPGRVRWPHRRHRRAARHQPQEPLGEDAQAWSGRKRLTRFTRSSPLGRSKV